MCPSSTFCPWRALRDPQLSLYNTDDIASHARTRRDAYTTRFPGWGVVKDSNPQPSIAGWGWRDSRSVWRLTGSALRGASSTLCTYGIRNVRELPYTNLQKKRKFEDRARFETGWRDIAGART